MTERALFGLGCFWEPDEHFSKLAGVRGVTVGYTGGTTPAPTYEDLGDHTEAVLIEFDPATISYADLLGHFWRQHDPARETVRQYRSAIWYFDEAQQQAATASRPAKAGTAIEPAGPFHEAEAYHQKYLAKYRAFRARGQ